MRPRGGEVRADIDNQKPRTHVRSRRCGALSIDDTARDRQETSGTRAAIEPGLSVDTGYSLRADIGNDPRFSRGRRRRK